MFKFVYAGLGCNVIFYPSRRLYSKIALRSVTDRAVWVTLLGASLIAAKLLEPASAALSALRLAMYSRIYARYLIRFLRRQRLTARVRLSLRWFATLRSWILISDLPANGS